MQLWVVFTRQVRYPSVQFLNEEQDMTAVLGMNLSNAFQSQPISLRQGVAQIVKLPVGLVKLFSSDGTDPNFWQTVFTHGVKAALGTTNEDIINLASGGFANKFVQNIKPFSQAISWICVGNEPLGSWYGD
jgi:hypothetical protein